MLSVSIIIVNYNTKQLTKACIDSVFLHTVDIEFEVIVVDNASTDGSIDLFKQDKRVVFIESNENLGFGKANNLGFKYAKGKYIFLLNSDTVLLNNAVKLFFDWMEHEDGHVACIGTCLLDIDRNYTYSYGKFPSVKNIISDILFSRLRKNRESSMCYSDKSYLNVDFVSGADLFIRRNVIDEFGLFDPNFFMYYEETDLQYRYMLHGYRSGVIFTPQIIHLQGASSLKKKNLRQLRMFIESRFLYCKKHFSKWEYIIIRLFFLLLTPRILINSSGWSEKKKLLGILWG